MILFLVTVFLLLAVAGLVVALSHKLEDTMPIDPRKEMLIAFLLFTGYYVVLVCQVLMKTGHSLGVMFAR